MRTGAIMHAEDARKHEASETRITKQETTVERHSQGAENLHVCAWFEKKKCR